MLNAIIKLRFILICSMSYYSIFFVYHICSSLIFAEKTNCRDSICFVFLKGIDRHLVHFHTTIIHEKTHVLDNYSENRAILGSTLNFSLWTDNTDTVTAWASTYHTALSIFQQTNKI